MPEDQTTQTLPSAESSMVASLEGFGEPPDESPERPVPQPDTETRQPEAAAPAEPSGEQPTEGEEETLGYDQLLPSRQAKEYPSELYSLAAKKWGLEDSDLEKPSIKSLLKGKIDSDILIAADRRQRELDALEPEPGEQLKPEQPETEPALVSFEDMQKTARQVAQAIVTPHGAKYAGTALYNAFAHMREALDAEDPKAQEAAQREITETGTELITMVFAQLLPKVAPQLFAQIADQRAGQESEIYSVYDQAREQLSQDPEYREVTQLYDSGKLADVLDEYYEQTGESLADKQFKNSAGKALPALQNAIAQYRCAIRWMRGGNYQEPTQLVKKGMAKGREQERRQAEQAGLGRLASGRTSGRLGTGARTEDDDMGDMLDAYDRANPVSLETVSGRK